MPDKPKTFGLHLDRFALTVDIVDDNTFDTIWSLVQDYLTRQLRITHFALLTEGEVNEEPGLRFFRPTNNALGSFALYTEDRYYRGAEAYAYGENKCLWVVSSDEGTPLKSSDHHHDMWSGSEELLSFTALASDEVRTAIVLPLKWDNRPFGVLKVESEQHIDATTVGKQELVLLSDTVARLLTSRKATDDQRQNTVKAIDNLRESLYQDTWPALEKPKIFVGSSGSADKSVMDRIKDVLGELGESFNVVFWTDMSESGDINQHILDEISSARFGLCYFSEPVEDDVAEAEPRYVDSPNVIFEAGMLQSLTNSPVAAPTGWIPVREKNSPRIPFDFATQRILEVPRGKGEQLNGKRFCEELRNRLNALLEQ